ncbi:propanediol utilization protein [Paenibacillus darwinianus]|uniref:Phosphate propanoyltransferase n=1 Tax=Paenibacillus darwinianus TaxID=1380763 RepID=A0A9W5S0B2_9BACL|nr:phosphate propanoyltransferase [Paenibacillus darwinianus]EXX87792.1 propanediol utilization protein [Paenibacillus darwinianus]EXX88117.1 propanediol utilization protein [Paenibacillus darwinianus]EXX89045.1 propanediol utilization protein [Paenibacillus darwinianus]
MALITETSLRALLIKGIPDPFPVAEGDKLTPAAADFLKGRGIPIRRCGEEPAKLPGRTEAGNLHIPVGVSSRHAHLSPEHVEALFGRGYSLTPMRELSQKGQYAAHETVTLIGSKGIIQNVRILGPSRGATQVEISRTDGFALGVHPPVRLSGQTEGTPGITLAGAKGTVVLPEGLIVAKNHVHMPPSDAMRFGVEQGDRLILQTTGERPVIFAEAAIRVNERFTLDFHIDTDEANAAGLSTGDAVRMIGKNGEITGSVRG